MRLGRGIGAWPHTRRREPLQQVALQVRVARDCRPAAARHACAGAHHSGMHRRQMRPTSRAWCRACDRHSGCHVVSSLTRRRSQHQTGQCTGWRHFRRSVPLAVQLLSRSARLLWRGSFLASVLTVCHKSQAQAQSSHVTVTVTRTATHLRKPPFSHNAARSAARTTAHSTCAITRGVQREAQNAAHQWAVASRAHGRTASAITAGALCRPNEGRHRTQTHGVREVKT
jgi:hypothetical protein